MKYLAAIIIALSLIAPMCAAASPGGLDANRCHVCRTNCQVYGLKTGERHCHQETIAPRQPQGSPLIPTTYEFPVWATIGTGVFIVIAIFLFWRFVCPKNRK